MFCWQSVWKKSFKGLLSIKALIIAECLSGRFPWCFCLEIGMSLGRCGTRGPEAGLCSWGGGCLAGLERTLVSVIVRRATRRPQSGGLGSRRTCLVVRTPGARAVRGGAGGVRARRTHPGGRDPAEAAHAGFWTPPRGLQRPSLGFGASGQPTTLAARVDCLGSRRFPAHAPFLPPIQTQKYLLS